MEVLLNMLKQRIFSSFGLWSTLLAVLFFFGISGAVGLIIVVNALAQCEFSKLLKPPFRQSIFDIALGLLFLLSYYFCSTGNHCQDLTYAFALIVIFNWSIFFGKTALAFLTSLFCFWYMPINLHFFLKIPELYVWESSTSLAVVIWVVLITKLTDVGGFFIGCAVGKHHLAPQVSPKKTWEGVGGGMLFALIGNILYFICFSKYLPDAFSFSKSLLFTLIMAWGSVVSDLLESLLKRQIQTKDSGRSIPGIGGVLDLIDSLLLNAPLAYILFKNFV